MQEKSKEYNEKEQQIAENRSRNTLFERRENFSAVMSHSELLHFLGKSQGCFL